MISRSKPKSWSLQILVVSPKVILSVAALLLGACSGNDPVSRGADLFVDVGCHACHQDTSNDLAPTLVGLWETQVALNDGTTVVADAQYVRSSIVNPPADVVAGWEPRMPFFPLNEEEVDVLVQYVRSLG